MDSRINKLEQKMIVKNIEIKNVNIEISAIDAIKKIVAFVNVTINDADIDNAYRLKRQNDKIIVEFSSLNKKVELMSKIKRHRVEANEINTNGNKDSSVKFIYFVKFYVFDFLYPPSKNYGYKHSNMYIYSGFW